MKNIAVIISPRKLLSIESLEMIGYADYILGLNLQRRGLNVLQVAMLDMQHLFHQPTAQKWLSSELHFATPAPKTSIQTRPMPSLRPTSLVAQLRKSLNPLMRNVFSLLLFF